MSDQLPVGTRVISRRAWTGFEHDNVERGRVSAGAVGRLTYYTEDGRPGIEFDGVVHTFPDLSDFEITASVITYWRIDYEVPAKFAIGRSAYWMTAKGAERIDDEHDARSMYASTQEKIEWPVRLVKVTEEVIERR